MIKYYRNSLFSSLIVLVSFFTYASKDVVVALYSPVTTLDPYDSHDTVSQAVAKSFYEGLFSFDRELNIKPLLATDYHISSDGLTYTINLRRGIKFHDGTEFNAQAVKINFDRVTSSKNQFKRSNLFHMIAKTQVNDTYQVQITLNQPFSAFIYTLAHPSAVMISPTALQQYQQQIARHPVGTGPFKLASLNPIGILKVTKFMDYWQPGLPKVDSITWEPIIENRERAQVMQNGQAHFAYTVPYEYFDLLANNEHLNIVTAPSIIQRYIAFNMQQKPFNDLRVRQALNYAINKQKLIDTAFSGHARIASGFVPSEIKFAQQYPAYPYDPDKAKALLTEAGYPHGFTLTLWSAHNNPTTQRVIHQIKQQLSEVGIEAKISALDSKQALALLESQTSPLDAEYQLYYSGWAASSPGIDFILAPLLATTSWPPYMFNCGFYSNTQVDTALKNALRSTNDNQKAHFYKTVQDTAYDDVPWINLVNDELVYVHTKKLTGMYVMPDGSFDFSHVDLEP